jgi:hypothetical protein
VRGNIGHIEVLNRGATGRIERLLRDAVNWRLNEQEEVLAPGWRPERVRWRTGHAARAQPASPRDKRGTQPHAREGLVSEAVDAGRSITQTHELMDGAEYTNALSP